MMLEHHRHETLVNVDFIARTLEASAVLMSSLARRSGGEPNNRNLIASSVDNLILLDGRDDDWSGVQSQGLGIEDVVDINLAYSADSLSARYKIGASSEYLYMFIKVLDDQVVYREINNPSVHRNDHLQIGLIDPAGDYQRYTIAAFQPASLKAHVVSTNGRSLREENLIDASWLATENGYNLELRIPLALVGDKFSFALADIDDSNERELQYLLGSSVVDSVLDLVDLIRPSSELQQFVSSMADANVWLLDNQKRVVSLSRKNSIHAEKETDIVYPISFESGFLSFFDSFNIQNEEVDVLADSGMELLFPTAKFLDVALSGTSGSIADLAAPEFAVAEPVYLDGEVVAVVVLQKSEQTLLQYIERVKKEMLVQFILLLVLGFIFWRVLVWLQTTRLTQIKVQLEQAIDTRGRVHDKLPRSDIPDEIGDLSRSFSDMVERLQQYNHYLESMASRLAHELRTPVSIVRSSLDNISTEQLDDENGVYVQRAHDGLQRLSLILNNMSEASRLEHSLDMEDVESFDLAQLVQGCVEGYRLAFPHASFDLSVEENTIAVTGLPDLIAQLFDKLIGNAVEFSLPETAIRIRLTVEQETAVLRVMNQGPGLPEDMRENLFDSMVSIRSEYDGTSSHLGLGLYIAKVITEFHGGEIALSNREDSHGVIATVRIPLLRLTSKLRL